MRLNKQWAPTLAAGRAVLQFAPESGTRFFEPYGWREIEYRSTFEEGIRLRRHMRGAWFYRLIGRLAGSKGREKMRRIGGIALLETDHRSPRTFADAAAATPATLRAARSISASVV